MRRDVAERVARKPFSVYMHPEIQRQFDEAASARGMSFSTWMVQAALSYLGKQKNYAKRSGAVDTYASGWPKSVRCKFCQKYHDPVEEHGVTLTDSELQEAIHAAR